jgi:phage shock protein A
VRIGEATTGLGEEMSDVGLAVQRAQDKTEQMQARAAAVDELVSTGAIDDLTLPPGSDIDQQLAQISASSQVDSELAKLKGELGSGGQGAKELSSGEKSEAER